MPSILLVDDEPHDRELALAVIQRAAPDADIQLANGGEEAIRELRLQADGGATRPDLVILDFKMPGVSGADVLRAIRADPAACRSPIVMFSASDSECNIREYYDLGANAYIRKPLSFWELKITLGGTVLDQLEPCLRKEWPGSKSSQMSKIANGSKASP